MKLSKLQVEQIKSARKILGLTQKEVANSVNISLHAYTTLESGKVDPLLKNIINIVKFFEDQGIDFNNFEQIQKGKNKNILGNFRTEYLVIARNSLKLTQETVGKAVKMHRKNYREMEAGIKGVRFSTGKRVIKFFEDQGIDFNKISKFYNIINENKDLLTVNKK